MWKFGQFGFLKTDASPRAATHDSSTIYTRYQTWAGVYSCARWARVIYGTRTEYSPVFFVETPDIGDKLELPKKDPQRTFLYVSGSFSVQLVASHPIADVL